MRIGTIILVIGFIGLVMQFMGIMHQHHGWFKDVEKDSIKIEEVYKDTTNTVTYHKF